MNTPHTHSQPPHADPDRRGHERIRPDDGAFFAWLRSVTGAGPRTSIVLLIVLLLFGTAAGVFVMTRHVHRVDVRMLQSGDPDTGAADTTDASQLELEARDDIAQAIHFYERAIAKLDVLATRNEPNLDSTFVSLQRERIRMLRASIDELKTALAENGGHPDVQHYLLTAYTDLQSALQELAHGTH